MTEIKKFIAVGPESTGKSTLCRLLAERYHTLWCPEYARAYLEENGPDYEYGDLERIALGQMRAEDEFADKVKSSRKSDLLFVDTDMHVMRVWYEYVYDNCEYMVLNELANRDCAGYFLLAPDLPWEADPLRELPDQRSRDKLFLYYQEILIAQGLPWVAIHGDYKARMRKAVEFVEAVR